MGDNGENPAVENPFPAIQRPMEKASLCKWLATTATVQAVPVGAPPGQGVDPRLVGQPVAVSVGPLQWACANKKLIALMLSHLHPGQREEVVQKLPYIVTDLTHCQACRLWERESRPPVPKPTVTEKARTN